MVIFERPIIYVMLGCLKRKPGVTKDYSPSVATSAKPLRFPKVPQSPIPNRPAANPAIHTDATPIAPFPHTSIHCPGCSGEVIFEKIEPQYQTEIPRLRAAVRLLPAYGGPKPFAGVFIEQQGERLSVGADRWPLASTTILRILVFLTVLFRGK